MDLGETLLDKEKDGHVGRVGPALTSRNLFLTRGESSDSALDHEFVVETCLSLSLSYILIKRKQIKVQSGVRDFRWRLITH